jgi:hypothetical protein
MCPDLARGRQKIAALSQPPDIFSRSPKGWISLQSISSNLRCDSQFSRNFIPLQHFPSNFICAQHFPGNMISAYAPWGFPGTSYEPGLSAVSFPSQWKYDLRFPGTLIYAFCFPTAVIYTLRFSRIAICAEDLPANRYVRCALLAPSYVPYAFQALWQMPRPCEMLQSLAALSHRLDIWPESPRSLTSRRRFPSNVICDRHLSAYLIPSVAHESRTRNEKLDGIELFAFGFNDFFAS